ncbi:MAG: VOC family protein [Hyphomicrobiaceae bacterium]|nr:VOC family protein [Hyphomicrobiaceae bacterium]MCC0023841.1 VOC family protein [Hyphomicrobiaceae bacterium]
MTRITPCLWFDGTAEQAALLHTSLIENSRMISPSVPTPEGGQPPMMVEWEIKGQRVLGLNGGPHYQLSPAFSFMVSVDGQDEVDRLWDGFIGAGGKESMCGWLEDPFGVSFQIVPIQLMQLMGDPDPEKAGRVRDAMFKMQKIIVADLEAAHRG